MDMYDNNSLHAFVSIYLSLFKLPDSVQAISEIQALTTALCILRHCPSIHIEGLLTVVDHCNSSTQPIVCHQIHTLLEEAAMFNLGTTHKPEVPLQRNILYD